MHPLIEDYTKLTDNELVEKITKISKIFHYANDPNLYNQVSMIYNSLLEEQTRRNVELLEKTNKTGKLSDIINIS
jgi:hypothetical protein